MNIKRHRFKWMLPIQVLLLVITVMDLHAAVIHVPADQPTIQDGIDAAADGDTVVVADGTYTGASNRGLDFGGRAITVRSKNGPKRCIIDGEEAGRGFYLHSGEGRDSAIRGFTITRCGVYNDTSHYWYRGGGIRCEGASPLIAGNLILDNRGSGIFCNDGAAPLIQGNTVNGNSPGWGAGIGCENASPAIVNNVVSNNSSAPTGPGWGGGISCAQSEAIIANNVISNNIAKGYAFDFPGRGGGIYGSEFNGRIEHNLILDNDVEGPGGGIYLSDSSPLVRNNLVAGNTADFDGGGISIESALESLLIDNTITGNHAAGGGGGLFISTGFTGPAPGNGTTYTTAVHDSILWGNSADFGAQVYITNHYSSDIARLFIHHSDVEDGEAGMVVAEAAQVCWGPGMIDTDPLFVAGPDGDFYLSQIAAGQGQDSPCVDTGEPGVAPPRGTTRTDRRRDQDTGDMGYHYPGIQRLIKR